MYSLILKVSHNTRVKDFIAVARGLYRVTEGAFPRGSASTIRTSSWMDNIPQNKVEPEQIVNSKRVEDSIKQNIKPDIELDSKINPEVKIYPESSTKQTLIHENSTQKQEAQKQASQVNQFATASQRGKQQKQQKLQKQQKQQKQQQKLQGKQQKEYLKQFKVISKSTISQKSPEVSAIPSSRIGRIFQFGKLGLSLASASIFSKGKDQSYYQDVAEKVSSQLCKMRGAPLKLAQMLSIQQQNLIPTPIRRAFEKARQSAHVIPPQQVQLMLKKNLGDNWRSRFKQFYDIPVASASIGQVHRAILLNGQEVAVKVQYHQVKESIESDIQNLGLLMRLPGVFPKGMYVEKILKNTRLQLMQQCDYLLEKWYQQKYDYYLKQAFGAESKLFKVPKVHPQFTTNEVLTSQFLSGIKMKDLQDEGYSQQLRNQIGRRIMKLTFKQLFQMGIMQSDPNPSNFTYNPTKDQLNLYDFGATHVYKKQFLESYYRIIQGAVNSDSKQIWEASISTGFVTGQENMTMKNSHIQSIMMTGEPLRSPGLYDFGSQEITNRIYKTIPLMLKNRLRPPPQEVYSLHRKLSGSYLACIRLKAKVDCNKIWEQIKFKTLASDEKYEEIKPDNSNSNIQN